MKKLILDRVLYTAILSSLFLIGCMPDSVTKFKEDTPTKSSDTTSSSSGSSSSSDTSTSATAIGSFDYFQVGGGSDRLVLKITDNTLLAGFSIGDTLYVSDTYPVDSGRSVLSIISIDTEREEMLVSVTTTGTDKFVGAGTFIDNCATGFATCTVGSSTAAEVASVSLYMDRTDTSASLSRTPVTSPVSASDFTFSITPEVELGMSFDEDTGAISMPVIPFLAPELDHETYTVFLRNGDGDIAQDSFTITTVKSNQYTLTYDYTISQRLVLEVDDASGFNYDDNVTDGNNEIYACTSSLYSACDTSGEYVGEAEIYFVDTSVTPHQLFITIGTDVNEVSFYDKYYIHASDGSFSTQISAEPIRLFNTGDTPTLTATLTPATTGESYSSSPGMTDGLALNASTGDITGSGTIYTRTSEEDGAYSIVVKDSNASTIATKSLRFRVVDAPASLGYLDTTPVEYIIGEEIGRNDPVVTGLPTESATTYYGIDATLPSGLSFDSSTGFISGTPVAFDSGTTYTLSGYHPFSGATAFDTYALNITTATSVQAIYVRQTLGDRLIIEVDDISKFSSGENLSTETGAQALINYVDTTNSRLFVTVTNATLQGSNVFKNDDNVDNTASFVAAEAIITKVTHEFKTTDDLTGSIVSDIFNVDGAVSLATGETVSYSISPALPDDMTFSTSAGTITGNSATGQAAMNETEYTISVTNAVGNTVLLSYFMVVSETPSDVSVALNQYIPVNAVSNTRFYKGMFVQSENGRAGVVIDTYENASNQIEGLYVSFSGLIDADEGIDNEFPYFSAETSKKNWGFIYVTAIDNFTVSGAISNSEDVQGTILAIAPETGGSATGPGRLLVEYALSTTGFSAGDSVDNASTFSAQEALISSASKQFEATTILTVDDSSDFPIGSYISTDGGAANPAVGLIVFNDETNEKLFVRTISGQFADGDDIDNEKTYDSDEGDILTIEATNLELTMTNDTDLVMGENATFAANGTSTHQASGSFNYDADTTDTSYFVEIASGIVENTDDIDDINPYSGTAEQTISLVEYDHLFRGYVGRYMYISTYTRGTVTEYSVSPSLPNGLTIDSDNGIISGTPTESKTRTLYTVTARNGSETATHTFSLAVLQQFRLWNNTSNTSSYILHKQGQGNEVAGCKVTNQQIDGSSSIDDVNNIVCVLDAGEADLYQKGITFQVDSSAGLCEYVSYTPYSINTFPIMTTDATYYEFTFSAGDFTACTSVTGDDVGSVIDATEVITNNRPNATSSWDNTFCASGTGCNSATTTASEPICLGDHKNTGLSDHDNYPNCDEGSYNIQSYDCSEDGSGGCTCTRTDSSVSCGGDRANCMGGPIVSELTDPVNTNNTITYGFTGLVQDYTAPGYSDIYTGYAPVSNTFVGNYAFLDGIALDGNNYIFNADNWATPARVSTSQAYAVSPIEGLNTHKYYTFSCLDSSYDEKARIRVIVRDWDRDFAPNNGVYNTDILDNTSGRMDDTTAQCFGSSCDTRRDWDALNSSVSVTSVPADSADITAGSPNVSSNGGGGDFLTSLYPGYLITIDSYSYVVESVTDNDNFVLTGNAITTATGATITVTAGTTLASYYDGDPIFTTADTVDITAGSTAVASNGGGGAFLSELTAGSLINIDGYSYIVSSVTDNNNFVLTENAKTTAVGATLKAYYDTVTAADTVDMTAGSRTITSNGGGGSFTTEITTGSVVQIDGLTFLVKSVTDDDNFEVTVPVPQSSTAETMTIFRTVPFPMDY